ncbi:MAG: TetR/AcrR family transcriptional regulator [Deltaproteobacteria bacterium]|nr:TetR/AcrR family transcriptional regulator [Deltaproteobacteria bacterium]
MRKKTIRKQQIIQAAIEVFSKSNFQNSSISEIAQKADIAEGTIYQYFKNKEDLFFSIPAQKTKEFCEELDLHLQGIHDAVSKIRKLIWYYLYFFKMNPDYARTLMLEMRVSKSFIQSKTYGSLKEFTDKVIEIIKEGQEEGIVRKDINLYLIRELVLGILEHRVTRWLLKEENYDLLENYSEVFDLIFNGIKNKL